MVEANHEISRADVFLALGRKSTANGGEIPPLGGRPVTPEEEKRMGEQLRHELHDYQAPMVEKRGRAYQAMSGKLTNSTKEVTTPIKI